ncbi:tRNA/tmRNA (uracil-C(5))-methyltransferase [Marinobacterium nitratireducens]|uniref:tRNA/tmRNA (uracil-C(5))-methyltransferase n=1 Tax=Marinobacterium nitratireducens TaxID=518897 RepID=A0A918DRI1_9GAMM|nr:tRNA (uridine(54)-C5)-methyltransferase TrmA [Marinobacterium nitratireducens]GGO79441.1 tRNA/tmRNA (uracil-C(5))-methyltransferase [Marinobacterium nitratireducens]
MALPKVDPTQYQALLAEKLDAVRQDFAAFALPDIEVFASPTEHYRMRAEFRVWHDGDDLDYVMFEPGNKHAPVALRECPMVSRRIHDVMFALLDEIRPDPLMRFRLFQVDFLSTLSGELLVTLLYHRPLDQAWEQKARELAQRFDIEIIGRSRKSKHVLSRDFVIERLDIDGREYRYKQVENCFTQPNAEVCRSMIGWALDVTRDAGGDLVELYCGNGNFTLPLARNFRRVVATEIAKVSVRAAQFNIAENAIDNIDVIRMSSEEFSQVLKGEREARRTAHLDLANYDFTTVLVDPPRSGLDPDTVAQVSEYRNIVYISCNPETLKQNLAELTRSHRIERFAIFDQFPYTEHLECGVYLTKIG